MPNTLIASNPTFIKERPLLAPGFSDKQSNIFLNVAELFSDTVQGEGVSTGVPSAFLRLQGCTLDCIWCDTASVWRFGNPYSPEEIFEKFESIGLIERFEKGQHLILTGGSPLKQQNQLAIFLAMFQAKYGFLPYIEVENECVLEPIWEFEKFVNQWNNSPKLSNSGMKERARYKPAVLTYTSNLENSWFKFVVEKEEDWQEIQKDFINLGLINRDQIILMPCGENQAELEITRPIAVEMAIKHGVRFCDRLHVTIWNKKTGV